MAKAVRTGMAALTASCSGLLLFLLCSLLFVLVVWHVQGLCFLVDNSNQVIEGAMIRDIPSLTAVFGYAHMKAAVGGIPDRHRTPTRTHQCKGNGKAGDGGVFNS